MKRVFSTISAALGVLALVIVLAGCPKIPKLVPGSMTSRVVAAIGEFPGIVRAAVPETAKNKLALEALDILGDAAKEWTKNPTASNWQHVLNLWNDSAKPKLLALGNTNITLVVSLTSVLFTQVVMPAEDSPDARVIVNFQEADVKALEDAIRKLKAEAK